MQNTLGYSRHRLQRRLLCACCARLVLSNARQHHKNVIPMQGLLLRAGKDKEGAGRERGEQALWAASQAHTLCSTVRSRDVDVEASRQASGSGRMNDLCVLD